MTTFFRRTSPSPQPQRVRATLLRAGGTLVVCLFACSHGTSSAPARKTSSAVGGTSSSAAGTGGTDDGALSGGAVGVTSDGGTAGSAPSDGGGDANGGASDLASGGTGTASAGRPPSSGGASGRGGKGAGAGRPNAAGAGGTNGGETAGAAGSGCGHAPPFTGRKSLTASVGGTTRNYDVIVPSSYDSNTPLSVVFEFHQAGGKIDDAVASGLHLVAGASTSAIFIYPQAIDFESYGVGWDESCTGHDTPLFDAALAYVESRFCVAPERVFATGFSWGGDFANAVSCCRTGVLRAVASASGAEWGAETGANASCGTKPLTPYRLTYGDMDTGYPQSQFDAVIKMFTTAGTCDAATDAVSPSPCVSYRGCKQPVIVCKYPGMGHQYPTDWAAATWAFFSQFQ